MTVVAIGSVLLAFAPARTESPDAPWRLLVAVIVGVAVAATGVLHSLLLGPTRTGALVALIACLIAAGLMGAAAIASPGRFGLTPGRLRFAVVALAVTATCTDPPAAVALLAVGALGALEAALLSCRPRLDHSGLLNGRRGAVLAIVTAGLALAASLGIVRAFPAG
ncbi:MAG: hypothetical protein FJ197_08940 [Gammaproteobacteria bacterium]|nr:hypothetical protein [Gammaproteobacteria bacterium]